MKHGGMSSSGDRERRFSDSRKRQLTNIAPVQRLPLKLMIKAASTNEFQGYIALLEGLRPLARGDSRKRRSGLPALARQSLSS
jgi:hypothetical protein